MLERAGTIQDEGEIEEGDGEYKIVEIISPGVKRQQLKEKGIVAAKITYIWIIQPGADALTPSHVCLGVITIMSGFENIVGEVVAPLLYVNCAFMVGGIVFNTAPRVFNFKKMNIPTAVWNGIITGFGAFYYTVRLAIAIYDFAVTGGRNVPVKIDNDPFYGLLTPFELIGIGTFIAYVAHHSTIGNNETIKKIQEAISQRIRNLTCYVGLHYAHKASKYFAQYFLTTIEAAALANVFIENIYLCSGNEKELRSITGALISLVIPAVVGLAFTIGYAIGSWLNKFSHSTVEKIFHVAAMFNMGLMLFVIVLGNKDATLEGHFLDDDDRVSLSVLFSIALSVALGLRPLKELYLFIRATINKHREHRENLPFGEPKLVEINNQGEELPLLPAPSKCCSTLFSNNFNKLFSCCLPKEPDYRSSELTYQGL